MTVRARLLGPLEVSVGGHRVEHWNGRKGPLLLAYLLLHRDGPPVPREALAVSFWRTRHRTRPATDCTSPCTPCARTCKRHRRSQSSCSVKTAICSTPIWISLDTEQFESTAECGMRAEKDDDVNAAMVAYQSATVEYRGDLLTDYPYDDSTLLPREHYRVLMLDVLGRVAQLDFDTGHYSASIEAGQRLLALDFCREDVHRLLMRAYVRVGRPHLAIHQFEICSRQLRRELDMAPALETVNLCGQIRARSAV